MFRRFFYGRYGSDQLNLAMLVAMVLLSLLNNVLYVLMPIPSLHWTMSVAVDALLVLSVIRMLSRNIPKRQAENRKWMSFVNRLRDRENRYFCCPQCKQRVRVPKGHGKVNIRCPKCGNKFLRKT